MIFENEINQEGDYKLNSEDIKLLDERRARHSSGKDKSSSWSEVHDRIRKKRK